MDTQQNTTTESLSREEQTWQIVSERSPVQIPASQDKAAPQQQQKK